MAVTATRSTFGRIAATEIIDVPASSSSPAEIDTTGNLVVQVAIQTETELYYCFAASAADAITAIAAYHCSKLPANAGIALPVAKNSTAKLYIRSVGSAGTKTLSYQLIEED